MEENKSDKTNTDQGKVTVQTSTSTADLPASKNQGLPFWFIQILAWVTGIGGLVADYTFNIFGDMHIPMMYYAALIGLAFGLNPSSIVKIIVEIANRGSNK